MDYLKQKTCFEKTCMIIPEFNYKGKSSGLYCYEHKKPYMVYLPDMVYLTKKILIKPRFGFNAFMIRFFLFLY